MPITTISLDNPILFDDPYPTWLSMLEQTAIAKINNMSDAWAVFRYDDVKELLQDSRLSSNRTNRYGQQLPDEIKDHQEELTGLLKRWLVFSDGERHKKNRKILVKAFKKSKLGSLRQSIQHHCQSIIEKHEDSSNNTLELMSELANPVPAFALSQWFDLRYDDTLELIHHIDNMVKILGSSTAELENSYDVLESTRFIMDRCQQEINKRRKQKTPDMISHLVWAEEDDYRLSDKDICAQMTMLLFAGQSMPRGLIGNAIFSLAQHPDQVDMLKNQPNDISLVIEEALRYMTPQPLIFRVAKETFTFKDVIIKKDDLIMLVLAAANRDPRHFKNPNDFDYKRNDLNLAFGHGHHYCLGTQFSKMITEEITLALMGADKILKADLDSAEWKQTIGFRNLSSLNLF